MAHTTLEQDLQQRNEFNLKLKKIVSKIKSYLEKNQAAFKYKDDGSLYKKDSEALREVLQDLKESQGLFTSCSINHSNPDPLYGIDSSINFNFRVSGAGRTSQHLYFKIVNGAVVLENPIRKNFTYGQLRKKIEKRNKLIEQAQELKLKLHALESEAFYDLDVTNRHTIRI